MASWRGAGGVEKQVYAQLDRRQAVSRRAMVILAGAVMAATVLAVSGMAWAAVGRPVITNPRPVPGSTIADTTPTVKATVKDRKTNLRKTNIALYLDGRRITTFTYRTRTDRLVYRRTTPLAAGAHTVRITARDRDRNTTTKRWSFRVAPQQAPLALPPSSKAPDNVPTVGPLNTQTTTVRSIVRAGDNVWVGGRFTQVERDGTVLDTVSNVAVFDAATGEYKSSLTPKLGEGDANAIVHDMAVYNGDVLIAGEFAGPSATQKNLVLVDGNTGQVKQWYDAPVLRSVLADPQRGRVYGGGVSLTAFDFASGNKLWTRAKTAVDETIQRNNPPAAGYRDLELDGNTIWAACACDSVEGQSTKALVKIDVATGDRDASWNTRASNLTVGVSLAQDGNNLYLGAGGDDFLAAYPKAGNGIPTWTRDTSGGVQAVEVVRGGLVLGGHFEEVADRKADDCGNQDDKDGIGLDPNNECQTRLGAAAYTLGGTLDGWAPKIQGGEEVWALRPDGTRLHVGGDFRQVNDADQSHHYVRLSP